MYPMLDQPEALCSRCGETIYLKAHQMPHDDAICEDCASGRTRGEADYCLDCGDGITAGDCSEGDGLCGVCREIREARERRLEEGARTA